MMNLVHLLSTENVSNFLNYEIKFFFLLLNELSYFLLRDYGASYIEGN